MTAPTSLVLAPAALDFVRERHLATLTTLRSDGTPHVTAVGFTWDQDTGVARIITDGASAKARNAAASGYAAVSQVDGGRWLTLEGPARVDTDPEAVLEAERRYAERYRTPRVNPTRVVVTIAATRVLGARNLTTA
ncbi:MAG: TIGR03618 family F420-dependent PPOX class oxidoreductase [Mycobacteriaceae bacterium]|nr:TIGR03618 family F420-dependent PPOX class oxidoreductase [Mycobacteriaceae bacterium]